ncbi:unnamed protein product [Staurois parvus]|uniref:Uncharacterized protein n=1 Tax=Staurois parvus TaxID=386267 RepID=A0ABN9BDJ7_9NEOB|nr:unnamed protein product [Staurois parvus]
MSGQYRYPPNVRTVQISPKCQNSTDIPQMSGQYRYPPNVRTVQISPKCQDSTDIPQMSGQDTFLQSRQSDVFHNRHDEFFEVVIFFS